MAIDYDLVLLGGNLWSFPLAIRAAAGGARVGWVTMHGITTSFYLERFMANNPSIPQNWRKYLESRGIDVMEAQGKFAGSSAFQVAQRRFTARHFAVCAPKRSFPNPNQFLEELHGGDISRAKITIAGGNYFSCAIAQFLSSQGKEVELLMPQSRILSNLDGEVARLLQAQMEATGIKIHPNRRLNGTEKAIFPIFPSLSGSIDLDLAEPKRIHFLRSPQDITSILRKTIGSSVSDEEVTHLQMQIVHTNPPLIQRGVSGMDDNLLCLRSWSEDYFLKVTCSWRGNIKGLVGMGQRAIDMLTASRWKTIKDMPANHTIAQELVHQFYPPTRPNLWLNICRDFDL